jgi:glycosyltransferase involved in cell wall biosynthesis
MHQCSLIIAFYNKLDYLEMVLAGLQRQSFKDYEIIIADDGSNEQTVSQIRDMISHAELPIHHVWHEDRGFRKNRILNQAIQKARGEYLVFIDMDCIPHREFMREHVLHGKTKKLSADLVQNGYLENHPCQLIFDGLFGQSKDVEKGIYLRSSWLRGILNRKTRGILGCNFSISKKNMLDINGFDEHYEAPARKPGALQKSTGSR